MVTLELDRRDAGRLLACVRERCAKLRKGHEKFKGNWDPEKGKNMSESFAAYAALEEKLEALIK